MTNLVAATYIWSTISCFSTHLKVSSHEVFVKGVQLSGDWRLRTWNVASTSLLKKEENFRKGAAFIRPKRETMWILIREQRSRPLKFACLPGKMTRVLVCKEEGQVTQVNKDWPCREESESVTYWKSFNRPTSSQSRRPPKKNNPQKFCFLSRKFSSTFNLPHVFPRNMER